jgi:hypothetical protein
MTFKTRPGKNATAAAGEDETANADTNSDADEDEAEVRQKHRDRSMAREYLEDNAIAAGRKTDVDAGNVSLSLNSIKEALHEDGVITNTEAEAVDLPEKAYELAANVARTKRKARAYVAAGSIRQEEEKTATSGAGGGRRRLAGASRPETEEISYNKVQQTLELDGLTLVGSECDDGSNQKQKDWCATKVAAAAFDASSDLSLEKRSGKNVTEALKGVRERTRKARRAYNKTKKAAPPSEATGERPTGEQQQEDDALDLSTPSDQIKLLLNRRKFTRKRNREARAKFALDLSPQATLDVVAGAEIKASGSDSVIALKGKVQAAEGTAIVAEKGATIDLTSTDEGSAALGRTSGSEGDTKPEIAGRAKAEGKGSKVKLDDVKLAVTGTIEAQNGATVSFARSKCSEHTRDTARPHRVQIGAESSEDESNADVSTEGADQIKADKKREMKASDAAAEISEDVDADVSIPVGEKEKKKDHTPENLKAALVKRGVINAEDAAPTVESGRRQLADYRAARRECSSALDRSKAVQDHRSIGNGAEYTDDDIKRSIAEKSSTTTTVGKSSWQLCKTCAEQARVESFLERSGTKDDEESTVTANGGGRRRLTDPPRL